MEERIGIPRRRLAIVAAAELVVVAAFGVAVWQVWQGREAAHPAATSTSAPGGAAATPEPTPAATPIALPQDGGATPSPAPGTNGATETASTLLQHLQQFNGLVSSIEGTETSVLQILIPGSVWYLRHVVVPRIEAALHGG